MKRCDEMKRAEAFRQGKRAWPERGKETCNAAPSGFIILARLKMDSAEESSEVVYAEGL